MSHTISVGDAVLHSDRWGVAPATLTRIAAIELCEAEGLKNGVACQSAQATDKNRLCVVLENGHWAYGHQIECVPHESVPDTLRHFALWFVGHYRVQGLSAFSHICKIVAEELGECNGQEQPPPPFKSEITSAQIEAVSARLVEAYHPLVTLRIDGKADLLQRVAILRAQYPSSSSAI